MALRAEMVTGAAGKLVDGMAEAADVLRELLSNKDAHIRHKGVTKLIELALIVAEVAELKRRLEEVESRLNPQEKGRR